MKKTLAIALLAITGTILSALAGLGLVTLLWIPGWQTLWLTVLEYGS